MEGILDRIREGKIPEHAKKAIVQGMMPLETDELILALFFVCRREREYLDDARQTFEQFPNGVKQQLFENKNADPEMLDFYLRKFRLPGEALSAALLNPALLGATIRDAAPSIPAQFLDLVVNNQVKIQEEPAIIEALRKNSALTVIHKQKLDEYERLLLRELVSSDEELEGKTLEEIEREAIAEAQEFVATFGKETFSAPKKEPLAKKVEAAKREVSAPAGEQHQAEKKSVLEEISGMSIPQKVQAAVKGDREYRNILIRDSNKLVCVAVIKSPRVTESEVEFYSNLRNIQTDVLRYIANNREWLKNYKIVHNLVKNPRTPIAFSMRLMSRLNKADLRFLVRDKGVPEALRTQARRMVRGQSK